MSIRRLRWISPRFAAAATAILLASACGAGASSSASGASGENPTEFYQGKTITFIIPYSPGGGFDTIGRVFSKYLAKELGHGTKVSVQNKPGGGSLIGTNTIFQAEPDGLTIGEINYPGQVFAQLSDTAGVKFKSDQWSFFSRLAAFNPVVYTSKDSGISSAQDLIDAQDQVVFGIGGAGSDAYYGTKVLANTLGFPYKLVTGYPGDAEADAALKANEVEARYQSIAAAMESFSKSEVNLDIYISTERSKKLPNVPAVTELGDAQDKDTLRTLGSIYDLERVVVGPPGIPDKRMDYLSKAISKTIKNPDFLSETKDAGYAVNPLDRLATKELVKKVAPSLKDLKSAIK